jgi:chromosome segregation ATPase
MRESKLSAILGIIVLSGILIYIVRLNEGLSQEQAELGRKLTGSKLDQTTFDEAMLNVRDRLEKLERALQKTDADGVTGRIYLQDKLTASENRLKPLEIGQKDLQRKLEDDLSKLTREKNGMTIDLTKAQLKIQGLEARVAQLRGEVETLKAPPASANKASPATSGVPPK